MPQDFTVDRASKKYVLGSDGFLKEYANDEPAIEFNADGSYKGVLVEPQSINEALQSEDLDNATYWNAFQTTIAGDTETDPKGGTNSFLLSETVDNDSHGINIENAYRPTVSAAGETWTKSIFVKKGNGANAPDIVQLTDIAIYFGTQYANFDISVGGATSGTVTASSGGTADIRYYGNGWYRISFTSTSTGAGESFLSLLFINNNPTATRLPTYAGQTDANVFIWGAQLEESPIATSYIPTTTGAVTRVKDDIYLTGASSLIGQTEGTLFIEVDWRLIGGTRQYLLKLQSSSVGGDHAYIRLDDNDQIRFQLQENGSAKVSDISQSGVKTGIQKLAFSYASADSKFAINGTTYTPLTNNAFTFTSTLNQIFLGQEINQTAQANMWIRAVALFTSRLTDTECEELTTI